MGILSLDCLTLTDTSPLELLRSAGFDLVSIWVNPPAAYPRQLLTRSMELECVRLIEDTGMAVHSVEAFDLVSEEAVRNYRPALERGARLGGKAAQVFHGVNPARDHVADLLEIEPGLIRYVQVNDGPRQVAFDAMRAEAAGERLYALQSWCPVSTG